MYFIDARRRVLVNGTLDRTVTVKAVELTVDAKLVTEPATDWDQRIEPSSFDWAAVVEESPLPAMLVAGAPHAPLIRGQIVHANAACRARLPLTTFSGGRHDCSLFEFLDPPASAIVGKLLDGDQANRAMGIRFCCCGPNASRSGCTTCQIFDVHVQPRTSGNVVVQLTITERPTDVDRTLEEQKRFRGALLELSHLSHRTEDDDEFYRRLIELAVDVVPGAQAGSVQLNLPGTTRFRFVATVGYDLAQLQRHTLDQTAFFRDASDPTARIVRDFGSDSRSSEIATWLDTAGRLSDIVVNVSAPVLANGSTVAFLSLDNFENADAMTDTSVEMTTVLGQLIGDLWLRRDLEAKLRKEREALRRQALHDPLTGVANRRSLEQTLASMAKASKHARALLFIDLDDFKQINDEFGHDVGDMLLVRVAEALSDAVRANDVVGRWGGDEFLVLPHRVASTSEVTELAQRILQRFERPVSLRPGLEVQASLSIGIGWTNPGDRPELTQLLRAADEALYEAKGAGKGGARLREVGA